MDIKEENIEKKPLPKHGGKYGKLTRPSRTKKRRYHPPKNYKKIDTADCNNELVCIPLQNNMDIDMVTSANVINVDESSSSGLNPFVVDQNVRNAAPSTEATKPSASSYKIQPLPIPDTSLKNNDSPPLPPPDCYVIMDTGLLLNFFGKLKPRCPECSCNLSIFHDVKKKAGLAHTFSCCCNCECFENCRWHETLCSSKPTARLGQQRRPGYEVNLRSLTAFREIGRGLKSIKDFCRVMNIPPPMDKKAYKKSFNHLYRAYSAVALKSLESAASQVIGIADDQGVTNVTASFDGTWQRRGCPSLNGVVSCISNRKVVDYEVLSKVCHQCKYWNNHKQHPKFNDLSVYHTCPINHTGSTGSMEVSGVKAIFQRSVEQFNMRYTTYLGDGDSKAYREVSDSNCYPGHPIEKAECIGHVQKRVGASLRTYISNYKGVNLDDGKKLTGHKQSNEHPSKFLPKICKKCRRVKPSTIDPGSSQKYHNFPHQVIIC